ncbi:hypothetical protein DFJ67_6450 [Asanoa ferruginea]|uniref:PknH-like protein n=1 Tax=Asanoa ferruginea TaxID=53367 RepID=A0A3D9ZTA9_9ACTN|nr:hypothetical protein [Asanoa ferruginea]REG00398.1 hypothetical protein DFJ67_6450 [Asanoa ferruginea]GIF52750.1 hypothetical protein Afe04nite_72890 [Asanoa ferruginea]
MRDFDSGWAQLASEVDGTGLAPAADLRHAADKRAHRRIAVVSGAVVVALVATGVAAFGRPGPPPIGPTDTPSPTVTGSPAPSPTPTTAPTTPPASPTPPASTSAQPSITSIPDRAFFALPRDMRRPEIGTETDVPQDEQVPGLCDDPLAADRSMTARRSKKTYYQAQNAPAGSTPEGSVTQTISAYRAGGAAEVMRRLRTALATCKTDTNGTIKYKVTTDRKPKYGDDAVHVVETMIIPPDRSNNGSANHRIVVIRVGEVVTVLTLLPWEQWEVDRDDAELFARLAVEAINDWR